MWTRRSVCRCPRGPPLRPASHRGRRRGVELMWELLEQHWPQKGGLRAKVRALSVPSGQRHAKFVTLLPAAVESEHQAAGVLLAASLVHAKDLEARIQR